MAGGGADHRTVTRRRLLQIAAAGGAAAAIAQLKWLPGLGLRRTLSASGPVYRLTTDLGVPASSSIDVSDAIPDALARMYSVMAPLGPAMVVTVLLEGFYRIDHSVLLEGFNSLRFAPGTNPSGFVRPAQMLQPDTWPKTPWYPYLVVRNSQDVTLEGFSIQGPLTTPQYNSVVEGAAGVVVMGSSRRVNVRGLSISGVHGDFIRVAEAGQYQPTEILFEGVTGNICGRQMFDDAGGNGTTIRRCHFSNSGRSGIDIEPSTSLGSHNITVEDSVFENPRLYCVAGGNSRPHRNVVLRRTSFFGGRGLIRYGPPESAAPGSHRGLYLEDITYEWRPDPTSAKTHADMRIVRTEDINLLRVNAFFTGGNPGLVEGTGEIRNCTFRSDTILPPDPVVRVCGLTEFDNVGTGLCTQTPPKKK